eukprot:gene2560-2602_t
MFFASRHLVLRLQALATGFFLLLATPALAQDKGVLHPQPLPPITNPDDPAVPAKELFGRAEAPANLEARSIGFYSRGCLAGAKALPVDGASWQVMRLSRNRNWAHPNLIAFLERFAAQVPHISHWPGILVGDISQPRGGPMRTGHASHQIGLDADIWLTPMPSYKLSRLEREDMSAANMVAADRLSVNSNWTADHMAVVKAAASSPEVERIFVNPAIKKQICAKAGPDRGWLHKVRPFYGHDYHFHVRIVCPAGDDACKDQDAVPAGDGCDASLDYWFSDAVLHPKPPTTPAKPKPPLTLAQLPAECRSVLVDQ